jgi:hypothetical protein
LRQFSNGTDVTRQQLELAMKSIKSLILGIALCLPFSLLGADLSVTIEQPDSTMSEMTQSPSGWGCCWIYFNGRWWCIPCANPEIDQAPAS